MPSGYRIEDAKAIAGSDKALLVEAPEFDEAVWIPQSQITDDSEVYKVGDEGTCIVTEWWADKEGWV